MNIGKGTQIYQPTVILDSENNEVMIGDRCSIGQFSFIAARKFTMMNDSEICPGAIIGGGGDVTIMEESTIAFGAKLIPATFTTKGNFMNDIVYRREPKHTNMIRGSIVIGRGAYVGSGAIICVSDSNPHIEIGDFSVIGALTYVDKDVSPNTIVHNSQILNRCKRNMTSSPS